MLFIKSSLLRVHYPFLTFGFYLLLFCTCFSTLTSCVKYRDLVNFQEGAKLDSLPTTVHNLPAYRLQTDDILTISVYSADKTVAEPFNISLLETASPTTSAQTTPTNSYLIDETGSIVMPIIGRVTLAGLTMSAARDTLTNRVTLYLKKPMVHIRLQNFKVTVTGEVSRPSTLTFPDEKVTILEALGEAGDLTQYARRDNILVIREQNGQREFGRVNLKSGDLFKSKYYYLTQNDVIYVEPLKSKTGAVADQTNKIAPWILIGITFLNVLASITK